MTSLKGNEEVFCNLDRRTYQAVRECLTGDCGRVFRKLVVRGLQVTALGAGNYWWGEVARDRMSDSDARHIRKMVDVGVLTQRYRNLVASEWAVEVFLPPGKKKQAPTPFGFTVLGPGDYYLTWPYWPIPPDRLNAVCDYLLATEKTAYGSMVQAAINLFSRVFNFSPDQGDSWSEYPLVVQMSDGTIGVTQFREHKRRMAGAVSSWYQQWLSDLSKDRSRIAGADLRQFISNPVQYFQLAEFLYTGV